MSDSIGLLGLSTEASDAIVRAQSYALHPLHRCYVLTPLPGAARSLSTHPPSPRALANVFALLDDVCMLCIARLHPPLPPPHTHLDVKEVAADHPRHSQGGLWP